MNYIDNAVTFLYALKVKFGEAARAGFALGV